MRACALLALLLVACFGVADPPRREGAAGGPMDDAPVAEGRATRDTAGAGGAAAEAPPPSPDPARTEEREAPPAPTLSTPAPASRAPSPKPKMKRRAEAERAEAVRAEPAPVERAEAVRAEPAPVERAEAAPVRLADAEPVAVVEPEPAPAPVERAEPEPVDPVEAWVDALPDSAIAYNRPERVPFGQTFDVELYIDTTGDAKAVVDAVDARREDNPHLVGPTHAATAKTGREVEVQLLGSNAEIDILEPTAQLLTSQRRGHWHWRIRPDGPDDIVLTLHVMAIQPGRATGLKVRSYEDIIVVHVTATQRARLWVADNWEWAWTFIVGPLAGWAWTRMRRRRRREAAGADA